MSTILTPNFSLPAGRFRVCCSKCEKQVDYVEGERDVAERLYTLRAECHDKKDRRLIRYDEIERMLEDGEDIILMFVDAVRPKHRWSQGPRINPLTHPRFYV